MDDPFGMLVLSLQEGRRPYSREKPFHDAATTSLPVGGYGEGE